MKHSNTGLSPAVVAISIPLLILGGCAGHETVKLSADANIENNEIIEPLEVVDGSEMQTGIIVDFIPEMQLTEVAQTPDTQTESATQDVALEVDEDVTGGGITQHAKTPKPGEGIVGFAFDKTSISAEYGEMLWQHAQYLQENKNLMLTISGHTDNSGARVYNEMLSLKRAQQVANILMDFGVSKERIKVTGNASDQPLIGAINNREHRRVELDFQDTQLVSN